MRISNAWILINVLSMISWNWSLDVEQYVWIGASDRYQWNLNGCIVPQLSWRYNMIRFIAVWQSLRFGFEFHCGTMIVLDHVFILRCRTTCACRICADVVVFNLNLDYEFKSLLVVMKNTLW
eukprot:97566_1